MLEQCSGMFELCQGLDATIMQNGYFRNMFRFFCIALFIFTTSVLTGCAGFLPAAGPNTRSVEKAADDPEVTGIQIVDVTDAVARKLIASQKPVFGDSGRRRPFGLCDRRRRRSCSVGVGGASRYAVQCRYD